MKRVVRVQASAAILALALGTAHAVEWALEGRVVGVSDGDTITVLDAAKVQHKVRLASIDAPEKAQAFCERSKQNLSALVFGKDVRADCNKRDRYGREVLPRLGYAVRLPQLRINSRRRA